VVELKDLCPMRAFMVSRSTPSSYRWVPKAWRKEWQVSLRSQPSLPSWAWICLDRKKVSMGLSILFRKKIAPWLSICKPVFREQVKSGFGKNRITVLTVLAMCDVEPQIFTVDILIAEGAYFADAQTRRIHENCHGFLL
jgi:hypothetical protein